MAFARWSQGTKWQERHLRNVELPPDRRIRRYQAVPTEGSTVLLNTGKVHRKVLILTTGHGVNLDGDRTVQVDVPVKQIIWLWLILRIHQQVMHYMKNKVD
jgi:hypothetical protein